MRTMIFDILDRKIKEMKDLRRLEEIKANKEQQEAIDTRYRVLLMQVDQFAGIVKFLNEKLEFKPSDSVNDDIDTLFEQLKNAIKTGFADKDEVSNAETTLKKVQVALKKDWAKHYSSITYTTVSTLRVISGIDADKVSSCLNNIKVAEAWTTDKKAFDALVTGLVEAEKLIQSLNMDQEIVAFLTSMNSGKTTIADLNEKVLAWIRKESLGTKIKLSFSGK